MAIQMHKGKVSKVVQNRDVRQHRKEGWTFKPSKESPKTTKKTAVVKPRATLKVEPEILKTTIEDLPSPEDFFNTNPKQED
tara:strand:+ start:366 stop:608 length:243 start_codon:yes stop_codon:yes gene_type:complete